MIGKWTRKGCFKMERKLIMNAVIKNRFLILSCLMLICGTFFGMGMIRYLPEEICKNIFNFISVFQKDYLNIFLNIFSFPFLILLALFFSGSCIFGNLTAPFLIFVFGAVEGFENSVVYMFLGENYIIYEMIYYLTGTVCFNYILIIMSENSLAAVKKLNYSIKETNSEKPYYNAKNQIVKFVAFTFVFVVISSFSAFIYVFVNSRNLFLF